MSLFPKKCVVVPIDFSSSSDEAIQTALEVTLKPEEVHVIHVALLPNFVPYVRSGQHGRSGTLAESGQDTSGRLFGIAAAVR